MNIPHPDPMHRPGDPDLHWSTDNVGEAAPGVLTPLAADLWAWVGDSMPRRIAYRMGVFTRAELEPPPDGRRIVQLFYGRVAMKMEYLAVVGDRMPGTTGEDAVAGLFGRVPEEMTFHPTRRRYPVVAVRLPVSMLRSPSAVRALARETDAWWRASIDTLGSLDLTDARALLLDDAAERFYRALEIHSLGLLSVVQPLIDGVTKLIERTGVGDLGALSGSGGAEMAIVGDMWKASRGEIGVDHVVREHGFHGPLEGEISSRVWREDPAPVERLVREYADRPDGDDPVLRAEQSRARLPALQRELLQALPRAQRPPARLVLTLGARMIPMRGVGKRSFLQALDVARGAARRIGEHLAGAGVLDDPEDIFYLVRDEIAAPPPEAKELVAWRRTRRAEYQQLTLPGGWSGVVEPMRLADVTSEPDEVGSIHGIGVSGGVVEGVVRVVKDPGFAEVEPDEILVAPTTDPSWSSIMFISSALVVDIGGTLSHAAVVARELGIPCVVNTRSGTRALRTGDRVRVDGSNGMIEILERAAITS